jgi:hypothetical protein
MVVLPEIKGAHEVAVLVKCLPNIADGAALIEQYASLVAAGAKIDAAQDMYDGIMERVSAEMRKEFSK